MTEREKEALFSFFALEYFICMAQKYLASHSSVQLQKLFINYQLLYLENSTLMYGDGHIFIMFYMGISTRADSCKLARIALDLLA